MSHIRATQAIVVIIASMLGNSAAKAETLFLELEARITSANIDIPQQYADLKQTFDLHPENGDTKLRLILPKFESYKTGTHVVQMNVGNTLNYGPTASQPPKIKTPGLSIVLESKLLGFLEGVSRRAPGGSIIVPDETQLADYGSITIKDGVVTEFTFGWVEPGNPGLASINNVLVTRRRFPIAVKTIKIDSKAFAPASVIGDIVLVRALTPQVRLETVPATPPATAPAAAPAAPAGPAGPAVQQ